MKNKNLYIGLGILAVAGIGFYMWKKKQGESSETETAGATEEKANAIGRFGRVSPRVAPVIAPIGTVGVGTVGGNLGGNITPTIVGKVKFHSIWNTKPRCPSPQTASKMSDGSWACTTPIN